MVEEDTVATIHAIRLPVVLHDPETIELGDRVGATGIERGSLALRNLLYFSVELRGGSLIDTTGLLQSADTYSLQQAENANCVSISRILRNVK